MNFINACEIGLKICTAVIAGVAIFVGIDQAISSRGSSKRFRSKGKDNTFDPDPENPMKHQPPTGSMNGGEGESVGRGQKFMDGLKGATSMCSKLLSFAQSLTSVAENFSRIFKDSPDNGYYGYYPPPGCYGGGWNEMGGQQWRRLSPFVIESVPSYNPSPNQSRYPF